MPAKNALKTYASGGYYHLYNRGVAKGEIFLKDQDYAVFLSYLKEYLSPPVPPTPEELRLMKYTYFRKNYSQKLSLLSFCLIPNHFHFLLKQDEPRVIEGFMRSLLVRYTTYFNKHHNRVGHLFQGVYKGILIDREDYLLWLSRYIHRNPLELLEEGEKLCDYPYSSYGAYLGKVKISWLKTEDVLAGRSASHYQDFVEGTEEEPEDLSPYTLES